MHSTFFLRVRNKIEPRYPTLVGVRMLRKIHENVTGERHMGAVRVRLRTTYLQTYVLDLAHGDIWPRLVVLYKSITPKDARSEFLPILPSSATYRLNPRRQTRTPQIHPDTSSCSMLIIPSFRTRRRRSPSAIIFLPALQPLHPMPMLMVSM